MIRAFAREGGREPESGRRCPSKRTGALRTMPKRLPIFRALPRVDGRLEALAARVFGRDAPEQCEDSRRILWRSASRTLELDKRAGALWFAEERSLWQDALESPALPSRGAATAAAAALFGSPGGPWKQTARVEINLEPRVERGTVATRRTPGNGRTHLQLDRFAGSTFLVTVQDPYGGRDLHVPVLGRTARANLTLGPGGGVHGMSFSWWPLVLEDHLPIVPAERWLREIPLAAGMEPAGAAATLAYREIEIAPGDWMLVPVWRLSRTVRCNGRRFRLMDTDVPATACPAPARAEPAQTRDVSARMATAAGPPHAYRAGLSWIGTLGGLLHSHTDAARTAAALRTLGWDIGFNWGNEAAVEDDWHRNSAAWADDVDLAYFCGHASHDCWVLTPPSDSKVDSYEVNAAASRGQSLYGRGRLRWLVLNACGPLHDPATGDSEMSSAIERWSGLFDGLRIVLAGASPLPENDLVGERFISLAARVPLIDAWFQANREHRQSAGNGQPAWVGALYARSSEESARHDSLPMPGSGSAPARLSPVEEIVGLWTPL
jgi:hypothetical protein